MSDETWYEDDNEYGQPSEGGQLRAQLKDFKSKYETEKAQRTELEKRLKSLESSRALEARGLPAKAAKYMEADGVDVTDARAVDEWLDDNKDDFTWAAKASAPSTPPQEPPAPEIPTEGFDRLMALQAGALSSIEPSTVEEFNASLSDDMDSTAFLQAAAKRFGLG